MFFIGLLRFVYIAAGLLAFNVQFYNFCYSCIWLLECTAEILVDFSKTYQHRFLLKPQNVEASCDFTYTWVKYFIFHVKWYCKNQNTGNFTTSINNAYK